MRYTSSATRAVNGGGKIFWAINVGDVAGFIGLLIGIVGFGVTIWQLVKTRDAAESAVEAARAATATSRTYAVLLLSPQFEKCEAQIESAAFQGDRSALFERLREWRSICAELGAFLDDYPVAKDDIVVSIGKSLKHIDPMKSRVTKATDTSSLVDLTEKFRNSSSEVASKVVELAAQVRNDLNRARR